MNMTFKELQEGKDSLLKVLHSTDVKDFDDSIAIGDLEPDLAKALKLLEIGMDTVRRPFLEIAATRTSVLHPQGMNTQLELAELKEKMDVEMDKICPVSLNFPVLKDETLKNMFASETKGLKLSAYDMRKLTDMGLRKTGKEKQ